MKKKLNVYWYKIKDGHGNFGDELNHYLISKLSGSNINHIIIPSTGIDYIYKSISFIYHGVVTKSDYTKLFVQFFLKDIIVGIGSVISVPKCSEAKIWGSGIIKKDDRINDAQFFAVRGKYTQKRLGELGLNIPEVIGDPALLLPLVYLPETTKKHKLGIIPHHIHFNRFIENIKDNRIKIINLTHPIEKIIDEINACEYTISTSLHGIIVSQAYGIPSLWINSNQKPLYGDNIKFYDYFSSVGIDEYTPFSFFIHDIEINKIIELFNENKSLACVKESLSQIQNNLLNAAPFNILEKYNICV